MPLSQHLSLWAMSNENMSNEETQRISDVDDDDEYGDDIQEEKFSFEESLAILDKTNNAFFGW